MESLKHFWQHVPWFSWEEWNDVYKNSFSNSAEAWKMAYDQICVWKARSFKLASGIESTIPLLHAQIALSDPSMDESFKNSVLNMAIVRFVSIASKGYEPRGANERIKPVEGIENVMNFPPFLIEMRNIIVHKDQVFGSSETLKAALDASVQWIKIHYWDDEAEKFKKTDKIGEKMQVKTDSISPEPLQNIKKRKEISGVTLAEDHKDLKGNIQDLVKNLDCLVKGDTNAILIPSENMTLFKKSIDTLFGKSPQQAIEVLVSNFFYAPQIQNLKTSGETEKECHTCVKCRRRWFLTEHCFLAANFLLRFVRKYRSINQFLEELLKQGKDAPWLCEDWLWALLNTVSAPHDSEGCTQHLFSVKDPTKLLRNIRWRRMLFGFYTVTQPCSSSLAAEIFDRRIIELDSKKEEILKALLDSYIGASTMPESALENGNEKAELCDEMLSLNDVMEKALKTSNTNSPHVMSTCRKIGFERRKEEVYLGVLPHQIDDPYFYQQLILHHPEPVKKKCKLKPT